MNARNTMKSYKTLALRELLAQRVTSCLILLAIILSTMLTAVIGQSLGTLAAMRKQQAIRLSGSQYATAVQLTAEQIAALQSDSRLSYVGVYITLASCELNRAISLGLNEYHGDALNAHPSLSQLKAGRLPQTALEIALPEDALQYLGASAQIGDTLTLSLSKYLRHGVEIEGYNFTADFKLVGITESNYLGYVAGLVQGIVGEGTAAALLPEKYIYYSADMRTADKTSFAATMRDLQANLPIHELDLTYNIAYLEALGVAYDDKAANTGDYAKMEVHISDEGFPLMQAAGLMLGLLLLLAAGLVIYNILRISVARRIKEYGILRATGATRNQLYLLVTAQALLLCAAGIPLGLLLGSLSAQAILTAATSLISPEVFMAQDSAELNRLIAENSSGQEATLLLSAAVTLLFALAAALPAAGFAARVSPITAMSGANLRIKRKNRRARRINNFERYYARLNLKRSPGRTAVTILSLIMSITVFIILQSSVSLLNVPYAASQHLGDYSLINEITGFSSAQLQTMREDKNVESVAAMQFALYSPNEQNQIADMQLNFALKPGETFQLVGLNPEYLTDFCQNRLTGEDLRRLENGEGCIVRNPIPLVIEGEEIARTELKAGDALNINGRELPILLTLNNYEAYLSVGNGGFYNGVQVITNDTLYSELSGRAEYNELLPRLKPGAERAQFDETLQKLAQQTPGTTWVSYEETDRQLAESFTQIRLLAWGLIGFVSLIGVLNIINTVYTNIHTRVAEIGMQRAIGMSANSLYKTFLWEGAYYAAFAAVFGGALGYLGTILTNSALEGSLELPPPPILPMLEAGALALAACLLATAVPLRSISRLSIVEAIENVE